MSQLAVAEQFDRMWRDKYPHVVSTLGTRNLYAEHVEQQLGLRLTRLPVPHHNFALWFFRTKDDMELFIRSLPRLRTPALPAG